MFPRYLTINEYDESIRKSEIEKLTSLFLEEGFIKNNFLKFSSSLDQSFIFESENNGTIIAQFARGCYPYRDKVPPVFPTPYLPGQDEFRKDISQPEYVPSQLGYNCRFIFFSTSEEKMREIDVRALKILPHWHIPNV